LTVTFVALCSKAHFQRCTDSHEFRQVVCCALSDSDYVSLLVQHLTCHSVNDNDSISRDAIGISWFAAAASE
jgi:hypothetical protein